MTCRAPQLAAALAALWAEPLDEVGTCTAPGAFAAVLPEIEGVQLAATVCEKHAEGLAHRLDGVRLVKRRT